VLSTQHDASVKETRDGEDYFSEKAREEVLEKLIKPVLASERPDLVKGKLVIMPPAGQAEPAVSEDDVKVYINPTGCFEVGGPDGDCGLTGRKIIVDTYGGRGRHGGGAFSGKDPSKVDRSAAYMARHVAKNIVAAGLAKRCEVQLAYAIGIAEPVSVLVSTEGTGAISDEKISEIVKQEFKLTPKAIREHLDLRRPIYQKSASGGHFGRSDADFTWEHTDHVDSLRKAAGI
jgi:S-adenosylmethionine synthetase